MCNKLAYTKTKGTYAIRAFFALSSGRGYCSLIYTSFHSLSQTD